jgi:hypothetical protein
MWSRFAVGVSAWLLGAAAATTGSVYAVDQLGHDLLTQQSKQVSVSMVNSELAQENSEHKTPLPGLSTSVTRPVRRHHHKARPSPTATPSADPGELLTSADGTAVATCTNGLAYLVYVTPDNGFEADHVNSGPALHASVVFRGPSGGIVMTVSCVAGEPHARISPLRDDDRGNGYDE